MIIHIMRTNIELDDDLVAEAQKYSTARTKRALVEEALASFIATKIEEKRRLSYQERLEALRAQTRTIRLRSDTRAILRESRESR
jgi:Arc/MetJ family transcription regulator